ncbi:MAG: solute:sodium symporter family transporter [Planctomycetota bacterium]|nr:MAG: solute:sodium symporter family transporter [Planctomycetota bacterium]
MELTWIDLVVFVGFMGTVVAVSLYAGRKERTSEDYFLAGRKLTWPLIGFSLIASNISTEHFVGMAGAAFGRVGLAIASYEWMAAITLVLVGWFLLPRFLKAGIYTMPEFLEYRYNSGTRAIMATYIMAAYIIVLLAVVLYSGAVAFNAIFNIPAILADKFGITLQDAEFWANIIAIWSIGIIAGTYTIYGGLKAVVWSDLLQGGALILGGAIVTILGLRLIGSGNPIEGWQTFAAQNAGKLHTVLPWNDPEVPWLAVFIGGLWIPNIFYWGCNQFITQRTLGAKSLAEGQKGIVFAAALKLLMPFIIVIPGIMALQLFGSEIAQLGGNIGDKAYPYMISRILPPQLRGVMFAALCGAVMSTFNSGLNSASTIFTIDIYRKYINPAASQHKQVTIGRIATAVIVVVACLWAPVVGQFKGVFTYIQEIWGFISPGIVAAFIIGLVIKKTPPTAAKGALLLGPVLYAICRVPAWIWEHIYYSRFPNATEVVAPEGFWGPIIKFSSWAFLHHMGLVFLVLAAFMLIVTKIKPLAEPVKMPHSDLDTSIHPQTYILGGLVIAATVVLYIIFW